VTAAELLAKLGRDEAYKAGRAIADEKLKSEQAFLAVSEAPLVKELRSAGGTLASVWDLVNRAETKLAHVHVLLDHLNRKYPDEIREGIARALAVPHARVGWNKLLNAFLAEPNSRGANGEPNQVKWALHLALSASADGSVLDELIALAADRRHQSHRLMFVDALARIGGAKAEAALRELRNDPGLADSFNRIGARTRKKKSRTFSS
jgi:hypothetical protein